MNKCGYFFYIAIRMVDTYTGNSRNISSVPSVKIDIQILRDIPVKHQQHTVASSSEGGRSQKFTSRYRMIRGYSFIRTGYVRN